MAAVLPDADDHEVTFAAQWWESPDLPDNLRPAFQNLRDVCSGPDRRCITRKDFAGVLAETNDDVGAIALIVAWGAGPSQWHWFADVKKNCGSWGDAASDVMRGGKPPYQAFEALWHQTNLAKSRLPGLGTAFGTKLLYWADRRRGIRDGALIYDARVHGALHHLRARWTPAEGAPSTFDHPWKCVRFTNYDAYCTLLRSVAGQIGDAHADDVECVLFSLGLSDGPKESGCDGRRGGGPDDDPESYDELTSVSSDLAALLRSYTWTLAYDPAEGE